MWKCLRCSNATPPHCSRSPDPRRRQAGQACADPDARGRPRGGAMATVVWPLVGAVDDHPGGQEITVTCQPRGGPRSDWHPKIDRRPFVSGGVLHEKLVSARLPLGRNVCIAELTEESSGHIIHHDSEQGTWNDSGYTTAQVQDDARGTAAGTWVGTRCTSDGPTCAAAISPPAAPSTEPTSSLGVAPTSLPSPARSPSTNTPTPACCTKSTIATAKNRGVEEDPYSR